MSKFENRSITYLELSLTHCAIWSVLERFILKVELNIVLTGILANCDIEVDLDSAFGNRSQFIRLAELYIISETKHKKATVSKQGQEFVKTY